MIDSNAGPYALCFYWYQQLSECRVCVLLQKAQLRMEIDPTNSQLADLAKASVWSAHHLLLLCSSINGMLHLFFNTPREAVLKQCTPATP